MNVIFLGKQEGKTNKIIERAATINGQIITNTVDDARTVIRRAREMALKIRKPVSIRQFNLLLGEISSERIPILVDDAEYCLQWLLNSGATGSNVKIDTISITDYKSYLRKP